MSTGLLALLDDVAAIAKVAAASLDDIAAQTAKAGAKAAGIVIDDAAVTPRYVVGFAADRELPIVWKIARGSLRNKLFYLLPAALVLSAFAPWAITPLLMFGGLFLCFEGYEKVHDWVAAVPPDMAATGSAALSGTALEDQKVAGAIRTDMILSAEIMAIALASITAPSLWQQAIVLAAVGVLITIVVYGAVAGIVKADDLGVRLAKRDAPVSQAVGRALVTYMPTLLGALSVVGTLAMLWVGGGILLHGIAHYGLVGPEHVIAEAGAIFSGIPALGGVLSWLVSAGLAGAVGLAVGWLAAKVLAAAGLGGH
jgi:uncharacterized protein